MPRFKICFGLATLVIVLAACARTPEATPAIGAAEPTAEPTAVATVAGSPTEAPLDYCLDCHTDKDQLIQTAKPVEAKESESEGVG